VQGYSKLGEDSRPRTYARGLSKCFLTFMTVND
jgi:hypothetical protein